VFASGSLLDQVPVFSPQWVLELLQIPFGMFRRLPGDGLHPNDARCILFEQQRRHLQPVHTPLVFGHTPRRLHPRDADSLRKLFAVFPGF
jgi:hypothetical protein